MWRQR